MSTIPISVTEEQFRVHIRPHLSTAKRGFVCKIALCKVFNYILYRLHTGCQWDQLPINPDPSAPEKKEISHDAVYYHFHKWSRDGSLERLLEHSILSIREQIDTHHLNLDGSHVGSRRSAPAAARGRRCAPATPACRGS